MAPSDDLDRLIAEWQSGDKSVESALFETLYGRIHALAIRLRQQRGAEMQATSLVHEAFLRIRRSGSVSVQNTNHFLRLIARVMKHVLTDRARAIHAACRGGDLERVYWSDSLISTEAEAEEILQVTRALGELSRTHPRLASVVDYTYYTGYTTEEVAALVGYSSRQVRRDLDEARARLGRLIDDRSRGTDQS